MPTLNALGEHVSKSLSPFFVFCCIVKLKWMNKLVQSVAETSQDMQLCGTEIQTTCCNLQALHEKYFNTFQDPSLWSTMPHLNVRCIRAYVSPCCWLHLDAHSLSSVAYLGSNRLFSRNISWRHFTRGACNVWGITASFVCLCSDGAGHRCAARRLRQGKRHCLIHRRAFAWCLGQHLQHVVFSTHAIPGPSTACPGRL